MPKPTYPTAQNKQTGHDWRSGTKGLLLKGGLQRNGLRRSGDPGFVSPHVFVFLFSFGAGRGAGTKTHGFTQKESGFQTSTGSVRTIPQPWRGISRSPDWIPENKQTVCGRTNGPSNGFGHSLKSKQPPYGPSHNQKQQNWEVTKV